MVLLLGRGPYGDAGEKERGKRNAARRQCSLGGFALVTRLMRSFRTLPRPPLRGPALDSASASFIFRRLLFPAKIQRRRARVSQSRTRQRRIGTFAAAAMALCLVLLSQPAARGQDVVRRALLTPGNSQPIQLYADNIATWTEAGRRVFLLQGEVWVEQGSVNVRMQQGVVWVDEKTQQASGVYNLDVYGEGGVALDSGSEKQKPPTAYLQLATRGEVRIKAYGGPVVQQALTNEPVFQRARVVQAAQPDNANRAAQNPVQAALPAPPAIMTNAVKNAPLAPPPIMSASPSAGEIQQVQAVQPPPSVVVPPSPSVVPPPPSVVPPAPGALPPPPPPTTTPVEVPPPLPPANAPPRRF